MASGSVLSEVFPMYRCSSQDIEVFIMELFMFVVLLAVTTIQKLKPSEDIYGKSQTKLTLFHVADETQS